MAADRAAVAAALRGDGVGGDGSGGGGGGGDSSGGGGGGGGQEPGASNGRLPLGVTLAFGGVSGLAAQTLTYPLDVIRRQMQVAGMGGEPLAAPAQQQPSVAVPRATIWATAQHIWRESGPRGFARGLTINFVKVVPSTAIGFTVYDAIKHI